MNRKIARTVTVVSCPPSRSNPFPAPAPILCCTLPTGLPRQEERVLGRRYSRRQRQRTAAALSGQARRRRGPVRPAYQALPASSKHLVSDREAATDREPTCQIVRGTTARG